MNPEKNLVKAFEPLNKILVDATKECIKNFVYKGGAFTDKFYSVTVGVSKVTKKANDFTITLGKGSWKTFNKETNKSDSGEVAVKIEDLFDFKPKLAAELVKQWLTIMRKPEVVEIYTKCKAAVEKAGYTIVSLTKKPEDFIKKSIHYPNRFTVDDTIFGHTVYDESDNSLHIQYEVFYTKEGAKKAEGYGQHILIVKVK